MELVTILIDSVKPAIKREQNDACIESAERERARPEVKPAVAQATMKRYTMDEINAMLDEAEAEIAAGKGIPDEEVWRKYDEEFALEEQRELEMA